MSPKRIPLGAKAVAILAVIALAFAGLLAAGCGGNSEPEETTEAGTVDIAQIEDRLKTILTRPGAPAQPSPIPGQTVAPATPGFEVKAVDCPDDVEQMQGNTFTCEVDAGEAKGDVDLTQKDDQGRVFSFNAKLKRPELTVTTKGTLDLNAAEAG
jgi:hypothetical protein